MGGGLQQISNKVLLLVAVILLEVIVVLAMFGLPSRNFMPVINNVPASVVLPQNSTVDDPLNLTRFYTYDNNMHTVLLNSGVMNETLTYQTNNDGLRSDVNYTYGKPQNTVRIGLFGDSFTYGIFNNINDTFASVLETRLNALNCSKKAQVLNFGVPGYDLPYDVEMFLQKGRNYNLDYAFFFLKDDDIKSINELWIPVYDNYGCWSKFGPAETSLSILKRVADCANVAQNQYNAKYFGAGYNETYWLQEWVDRPLKALGKYRGATVVSLFTFLMNSNFNFDDYIKTESSKYGFTLLDHHSIPWPQSLWDSALDSHPNRLGHQLIADYLYGWVIDNNIVGC